MYTVTLQEDDRWYSGGQYDNTSIDTYANRVYNIVINEKRYGLITIEKNIQLKEFSIVVLFLPMHKEFRMTTTGSWKTVMEQVVDFTKTSWEQV